MWITGPDFTGPDFGGPMNERQAAHCEAEAPGLSKPRSQHSAGFRSLTWLT
jgi:hypothetical protein